MTPFFAGICGFLMLLILLFLGMPVAFVMMFVGLLGISFLASWDAACFALARTIYETCSHYPYTIIPLFVFMGSVATSSGMTRELYEAFDGWFGRLPGGLGVATIASCTVFAGLSGSSVAASAAMGSIAIPEMRRLGYAPHFAAGIVAAGGTLSFLIPPSLGFVIYGMLTDQSIGKLLISGILPGIVLSLSYGFVVVIWATMDPKIAPLRTRAIGTAEKFRKIRGIWEAVLIFFVVMGGIYSGYINPTEAGAVGAMAVFLISLVKGKLTLKSLFEALLESTKISVMVLFIVAGANLFSYFLALSTIPIGLSTWISGLGISKYVILVLLSVLYLFLGCFFDAISMMVLTMPFIFPLIQKLGFDPIWFGVFCVLMMEAGLITPPLGLNVYAIAGIARDVPMVEIFKGALPFVFSIILTLVLITYFPGLALYLPGLMKR